MDRRPPYFFIKKKVVVEYWEEKRSFVTVSIQEVNPLGAKEKKVFSFHSSSRKPVKIPEFQRDSACHRNNKDLMVFSKVEKSLLDRKCLREELLRFSFPEKN